MHEVGTRKPRQLRLTPLKKKRLENICAICRTVIQFGSSTVFYQKRTYHILCLMDRDNATEYPSLYETLQKQMKRLPCYYCGNAIVPGDAELGPYRTITPVHGPPRHYHSRYGIFPITNQGRSCLEIEYDVRSRAKSK